MSGWSRYYDAVAGADPRATLLAALDAWDRPPGMALDLGCGSGRDTLALIKRGWRVHAIDAEPEALRRLEAGLAAEDRPRLSSACIRFEQAALPEADLVNASFSLPFCEPRAFPAFWRALTGALTPGGLFAGHLFGERDEWAGRGLTVLTREEAESLLRDFDIIRFEESERDSRTAVGALKHWHLYEIVARRAR